MTLRGADIVIRTLLYAGIHKLFALSGNHIMSIFDAAIGHDIDIIHTRHEAAAVHMADAYARMTGTVGVALVTGGVGHVNALGALCTARAGETPLLLLSGHAPLAERGKGAFQELRQAEIAGPLTKASWTAQSATNLASELARAIQIAQSGRPGPVHISLPSDILDASVTQDGMNPPPDLTPDIQLLPTETARMIIGLLRGTDRPLIIAPPALCTIKGRSELKRLDQLGIPIITTESPRGLNDPSLGDIGRLLRGADLILLLGKTLDFTLNFGSNVMAAEPGRWVILEPDMEMLDRAIQLLPVRPILHAIADPVAAIDALLAALDPGPIAFPAWNNSVRDALARRPPPAVIPSQALNSASLCSAVNDFVTSREDTIFISDGGEIGQWAQALILVEDRLINGIAGAIGPSIPFAIGAKAAAPGRLVLAVMGDGTFGFHMAEFETAVRHNLPFVAVIGNDGRWNAEYQLQLRKYGSARATGCELYQATRYDAVATALGGYGELVMSIGEVIPALQRAFASGKPSCLNVMIEGLPAPKFAH